MGKVEQSPPPITMAFTSSYTYEWLQNHYLTFDEERRLLLADYIYKSYMGYRPGGVTGRVAGAK